MNVPSIEFLGFAMVVVIVVNSSTKPAWRRGVFALANLVFISSFTQNPLLLVPFAGLLVSGYAALKLVESSKQRSAFVFLVITIIFLFCWLKRYTFIPSFLFLPYAYFTVGMSYVFFRVLHLVLDAHSGSLSERIGLVGYISYTLSFTSLVSGPIQLYEDYRRTEVEHPASLTPATIGTAVERMIFGYFKVVLLSPLLGDLQSRAFAALIPSLDFGHRTLFAAVAVAIFPIYLYINFSGYTDFVVGAARLMRLELPENFNRPFESTGLIEFWSRWNMTLSGWLKRYVYTSVAIGLLRRVSNPSAEPYISVVAYFATFFLVGAWHGQTRMFLIYGILQGAGVSLNKLYSITMTRRLGRKPYRQLCKHPVYSAASRGLTFTYFAVSLLWFWMTEGQLSTAIAMLGAWAIVAAISIVICCAALALAGIYGVEIVLASSRLRHASGVQAVYFRTAWCTSLVVLMLSAAGIFQTPAPHIVYRAF